MVEPDGKHETFGLDACFESHQPQEAGCPGGGEEQDQEKLAALRLLMTEGALLAEEDPAHALMASGIRSRLNVPRNAIQLFACGSDEIVVRQIPLLVGRAEAVSAHLRRVDSEQAPTEGGE